MSDAALFLASTHIDRRGRSENTSFFLFWLNFPAEQETAPCKTCPKAGHEDKVVLFNLFRFNSFRKTDRNGSGRCVGIPVDIDGDLRILQTQLFHGGVD